MAGTNGSADVDTLGIEWHDEQLQRVRAVFESVDTGGADAVVRERVLAEMPDSDEGLLLGISALRDLLRVEHRPERFRRLLRIWSGKVTAGVRSRQFEAAGMWLRALVEAPVFPEEFSHLVAGMRRDLARDGLLEELVTGVVEEGSPPEAAPLLATWGEPLVEFLISQIVTDHPLVNRRHIVDFLGMAGRGDVRHLTARLADPRWFVVRNVATAIGKAGRATALPALEAVADHEDERVRVEVLRAVSALKGDDGTPDILAALDDPSPKVRQAAVSLLRASPSEDVVPGVVAVVDRGDVSADDARRLVDVITERRDASVREALEGLADRRFAIGTTKAVRDQARRALEGWSE